MKKLSVLMFAFVLASPLYQVQAHDHMPGHPHHDMGKCWDHIKKSGKFIPSFPTIQFSNGSIITIDELCVEGTHLRPKQPYREQCMEWSQGENQECLKSEQVYLSTPISYMENRCTEYTDRGEAGAECTNFEEVYDTRALKYDVQVNKIVGDGILVPAFKMPFEIPVCNPM